MFNSKEKSKEKLNFQLKNNANHRQFENKIGTFSDIEICEHIRMPIWISLFGK